MNIFEKATRTKLRITIPQGRGLVQGTVEDLWDLQIRKLKLMAEELYQALRVANDTLYGESKADPKQELTLKILKHIIDVKESELKAKDQENIKAERKRKILAALAEKQEDEFKSKSAEELEAELKALEEE